MNVQLPELLQIGVGIDIHPAVRAADQRIILIPKPLQQAPGAVDADWAGNPFIATWSSMP